MGFLKIKKVIRPEDNFELECLDKSDAVAIVLFNSDYSKVTNNLYRLQYSYAFLWNVGCFMRYISTYQYYPIIIYAL